MALRFRITITPPPCDGWAKTFTEDQFREWCLAATGGGWTANQTRDAMILFNRAKERGEAHLRHFHIERLDEVVANATIETQS